MAKHEQAVALLGRLDGSFQDHPGRLNISPWVLYRPLRLREARLSSKIENTIASASEIEVANLLRLERSEPLEVRNYITAIDRAVGQEGPLSEMRIRALHEALLEGVEGGDRKFPGQYRPNQVMIGDDGDSFADARFVPPPAGEVPALMRDLVDFMREPPAGMPVLIAAALAHYQFETIHPFADGNGRLGRMLITLSLCEGTILSKPLIYPSGYINQHKQQYYDLLLRVSTHGDWAAWINYFLDVLDVSIDDTFNAARIISSQRFVKAWIADAKTHGMSIVPVEHLRTVYHTQTEQTPAIANREFHKRLDRNGLNVQRKRMPGTDRDAGGVRGIVINWTTDHEQLDEIVNQHFDNKDKVLIANE